MSKPSSFDEKSSSAILMSFSRQYVSFMEKEFDEKLQIFRGNIEKNPGKTATHFKKFIGSAVMVVPYAGDLCRTGIETLIDKIDKGIRRNEVESFMKEFSNISLDGKKKAKRAFIEQAVTIVLVWEETFFRFLMNEDINDVALLLMAKHAVERILQYCGSKDEHKDATLEKSLVMGKSKDSNQTIPGNKKMIIDKIYGTPYLVISTTTSNGEVKFEYYQRKQTNKKKFLDSFGLSKDDADKCGYRRLFSTESFDQSNYEYVGNSQFEYILKWSNIQNYIDEIYQKLLAEDSRYDKEQIVSTLSQIIDSTHEIQNLIGHQIDHVRINDDPALKKENKIANVCQSLKTHYKDDLELIEIQWRKFNVSGILEMDVFYNQNIVIEDKNKKLKTEVESFDHLFSYNCKRIIITADAGYGKSTFVHEMARQWVKGQSEWTKKFLFVFLIRLSEVSQNETQSLQTLLTMCFNTKDSSTVSHWLEDSEHMEKCLFIFDGLDELRQQFCDKIDDLIFGRRVKLAHVVVTSRPYKELMQKFEDVFSNNFYIELKGYTEKGVIRQLEKFKINLKSVENNSRDILKVPLFNTLFCIAHEETTIGCLNISTSINKFVKFACNRHRKMNLNFSEIEENEIIMMLGQAAQNKFSLMKGVNIEYPNVTPQQLSTAVKIGLVSKKSTKEDFVFVHQTIAEYCASRFWGKTTLSVIKIMNRYGNVDFAEPEGGSLDYTELFSCFLSQLDNKYKQFLWGNFEYFVPLFDEYDSLPKRILEGHELDLRFVPIVEQNTVMDKIEFSKKYKAFGDESFELYCINLESGKKFETITKMEHLQLSCCTFNLSPKEFFYTSNITKLVLHKCTFNDWNPAGEELKDICNNDLVLEYLHILDCDITVSKFLSGMMTHSTTLKTLKLWRLFESRTDGCSFDYYGDGWISELQNNKNLLQSIEHVELIFDDPIDLTILFETLGEIVNLKNLYLTIENRNLTNCEMNSLKLLFENVKKKIKKELKFNIKGENRKEINEENFPMLSQAGNLMSRDPKMMKDSLEGTLAIKEKHYGPDHYRVAATLHELGCAHGNLGDPKMQKGLLERALVIKEKHYGLEHYQVAATLYGLGNAYGNLGDPKMQKGLLERALMIEEKHYGPEHFEVAATLHELGCAYGALGDTKMKKVLLERALAINEKHCKPDHYRVAATLHELGCAHGDLGDTKMKKELLERAWAINEKHYGPDHYRVAATLYELGCAHGDLGDTKMKKELLERAWAINEKHYGPDHFRVAATLHELGCTHGDLGDTKMKKELLERALAIKEKHYEPEHFQVAATLHELGCAHGDLGNTKMKKELLEKAWAINEKHYGQDHYRVAATLHELGCAHGDLGDAKMKKELLERALAIKEKHYGPDHYRVAATLHELGSTHGDLGDTKMKKELLERALAIKEKDYGPEHFQVAATLHELGCAHGDFGDTKMKKELLERAWAINEKHYGQDHYRVAATLHELGCAHGDLGDTKMKKELLERALAIKEKHYGPDHYQVAATLCGLGNAYGNLGDPKKMKDLLKRALVIEEKHYGAEHYQVAATLQCLGDAYGALGDLKMQKDFLERAFAMKEKHYGPEHYQVAATICSLGNAYGNLGDPQMMKDLLERALAIEEKHYGAEHYQVAATLYSLGYAYGNLGDPKMKKDLLERALAIEEKHYGPDNYQVAATLHELGCTHGALGDTKMKKLLLERALAINEKHYGPDHYQVAATLYGIGDAYGALGDPKMQKDLLERAVTIEVKHYGPDHYQIAATLQCLGDAYGALGDPKMQKDLLERTLAIKMKHYGSEHIQVAATLVNLGCAYDDLGDQK